PQILQLQGDLGECLSPQQRLQLEAVRFSSRFALALFFPPAADLCLPWVARYVSDSILRYVAVDNRKRGAEPPGVGPSLVVHTSVPFGLEHLERDKEEVQPIVLQELSRLLPDLPRPISIKCQKWRYSQVQTAVPDCPGHMTVSGRPPLLLAGDAFSHSNFDGCLESALSAVAALRPALDALRA
ncbi:renalase, partial [Menidia menidia]